MMTFFWFIGCLKAVTQLINEYLYKDDILVHKQIYGYEFQKGLEMLGEDEEYKDDEVV